MGKKAKKGDEEEIVDYDGKYWNIGLFDCCSSSYTCCGICCGPCLAAEINTKVKAFVDGHWFAACCCPCLAIWANGRQLVEDGEIEEPGNGCVKTVCCAPCYNIQQAEQLQIDEEE